VVELFAGVGGLRLGLERSSEIYKTIWSNQWEPNRKKQHAFECYVKNFGSVSVNSNQDITTAKAEIPEHDLLTGGFPCQDYSVARTSAKGIEGKKGVLWWEIRDIVEKCRPEFILLENVDRLLKSPAAQRGRDFGIILRCLDDLGYLVEWRVVNAAEYGHPQKRRRTFIFANRKDSVIYSKLYADNSKREIVYRRGFFAQAFPVKSKTSSSLFDFEHNISNAAYSDLLEISASFRLDFENAGIMNEGKVFTERVIPDYAGPFRTLGDVLENHEVDDKYFITKDIEKWQYLKGAKHEQRIKPNGEPYYYTEGAIPYPDNLDTPSRTMLTSESSINRSTHIILDKKTNNLRLLTPVECERLNEFPDNWTNTGMPEKFRYFVMGNALVVGVIETMGRTLSHLIEEFSE